MVAVLSQDEVEAGLRRKGFKRSNTDHRYYTLYVNEKREAATFLSHGKNQDIGAPLLTAMAKELGINASDFIDLVKCPLSTEDYLDKKKDRLATALRLLKRG